MRKGWGILGVLLVAALCGIGGRAAPSDILQPASSARPIPGLLDLSRIKVEAVAFSFVTEYQGANARYKENEPTKYHGVVVTLRITKPAGTAITLHAPDISLHYYRGSDYDVTPCKGISVFSSDLGVDRPAQIFALGYGKVATGPGTTAARMVYVDIFFMYMEPDTTDMFVLIGQSVGASVVTQGWSSSGFS